MQNFRNKMENRKPNIPVEKTDIFSTGFYLSRSMVTGLSNPVEGRKLPSTPALYFGGSMEQKEFQIVEPVTIREGVVRLLAIEVRATYKVVNLSFEHAFGTENRWGLEVESVDVLEITDEDGADMMNKCDMKEVQKLAEEEAENKTN